MCRMLFAAGNFNIDWVIQDFILMASDQNEKHEKNMDKIFMVMAGELPILKMGS